MNTHKKQTKSQNGFSGVLALLAVGVVVVIVAVFFFAQKGGMTGTQQTTQNVPAIESTSDLNTASSDLDSSDTSTLDQELTQLNTDTSGF